MTHDHQDFHPGWSRRAFLSTAVAGPLAAAGGRAQQRPAFAFTQYHNQTADSPLHRRLTDMWTAVRDESGGRIEVRVFPENNKHPGSDPAVLQMLVAGEVEFFTLMGGILGNVVPAANVQQVPFAFRSAAAAHRAMDGALGAYLRQEMTARGIVGFPVGAFDNGMRQMAGRTRPIRTPADLAGLRMRVPDGRMFDDLFRALGSEPVTVNSSGIYDALKSGRVDAQENPLAYMHSFRHYEVMKYVSMTNHMWSGFNLIANRAAWNRLPDDLKTLIERHAARAVRLQRQDQERANRDARGALAGRGLAFNDADEAPFRARLSGLYATWKQMLGATCWSLLEAEVGRLG
ncbi:MAG: TRAP transporter substrate-binding protein [Acidobacteria bacterium]|nr:TRAP transporter substrate-binding protein [Acidobacteriota bacterium]